MILQDVTLGAVIRAVSYNIMLMHWKTFQDHISFMLQGLLNHRVSPLEPRGDRNEDIEDF